MRASSTCELILDDCRVPRENVLGEVGKGYKIAIETLNEGRIAIGAQMIGLARGRSITPRHMPRSASSSASPSREFQGVQFELAPHGHGTRSGASAGVQRAPGCAMPGMPLSPRPRWPSISPRRSRRRSRRKPIEIHGGVGITKDYPVEKLYRDAKIGRIYEGTSNIQLLTIAKKLLGVSHVSRQEEIQDAQCRFLPSCSGAAAAAAPRRRPADLDPAEIIQSSPPRKPNSAKRAKTTPTGRP